jgi:C4-dicarboxylate-specific signal transduction histidine kinase
MIKGDFKSDSVEEKLLEIESLTAYMSKTIDDFKNFFNPNKQKSTFKIQQAIDKAYSIVKGTMKSHDIEMDIQVNLQIEYTSYLEELQQVILTILNNAIDALVSSEVSSPKISVLVYQENMQIIIEIKDNALGIDKNIIDKIFEPYFTTKYKSQGTGLGLYMAKMIIENAFDGILTVENILNGACFKLILPIDEKE